MKTKYFYNAFNILYDLVKESLGIFQKEELYRQLFQAIYVMSGDALYDNDSIRKITSGNQTIHLRAVKKLHTPEGFEKFRRDIERVCLTNINSPVDVANKLLEQCEQVSEETGRTIKSSFNDDTPYQISRAVAAVLIFLNHADYASSKGKHTVLNIDFMRLGEEQPLLSYPKFITNIPNAAVDRLVGRIDEINEVYQEIVEGDGKLMVTGVGGLGKTVVVQQFLNKLQNTPTEESQIEKIAWIPYDNHDICLSMKQALHLKALKYNEMARSIEEELFAEYSITRMRSLNTKALVVWEQGKHQDADDIFEYIITTSEQMSSDYLPDVADFLFNYARCLHDQDEDEKAKAQYLKCINIWSEMSEDGNRKLALAHQEIADIFFSENNAADALEHYVLAEKFNAEDFYVEVDVLDSVAACLLLLDKPEEGIQKFKELLEILVKYKANDTEAKFQLCNNLFCIIDAESEEEIELREMLMEQIKDEPATVEYVHNFLTNREEK